MGIQKEIVCGIDIGGTNTVCGVLDIDGECYGTIRIGSRDYETVDEFITALSTSIMTLLSSLNFDYKLHGIGVGAPNANFSRGTVEYAPNLRWRGILPLASMIERSMGTPVVLTNDANAAAIGEGIYGNARGMKNFIVITLGTGVGSGIVVDGRLLYGASGFAGELGHTIVHPEGRICSCGRRGCLEAYVSASGISMTAIELLSNSSQYSLLREIPQKEITPKEIFIAAKQGDIIASETFKITGEEIGLAITNAVAILSPEAIFLFGGVSGAGELILKPISESVERHILPIFRDSFQVLLSGLDENMAAIKGAAALAWSEINRD